MKTRVIWTTLGMAFAVTLAVVVGQRLSSEAMAVMVGVVAGVVASIPTSLIVVWVATRSTARAPGAPDMRPEASVYRARPESPRIVVLQQPLPANYPLAAPSYPVPYGSAAGAGYSGPRRYTVVGGVGQVTEDEGGFQEVLWEE